VTDVLPAPEADDSWLRAAFDRYAVTQDVALRDEIAARMSWIASRSARRFAHSGEPMDDLEQVAQIGLLKAIGRFDPTRGVPFGAYATPTIIGELRRHFRDHTWSVHVPRRAKDLRSAVNAAREVLTESLARSPQVSEIADHLHVSAEAVFEALEANHAYRTQALEVDGARATTSGDDDVDDVLDRAVIAELLGQLPLREQTILRLRFFDELTQAEIADRIGTSQVHVGRLISSSLLVLRRLHDGPRRRGR
jgi:RNA polymerase sigma-B factor